MELIKLKSIIQLISHSSVSRNSQELTTFNTQIIGRFTRISSTLALYGVDNCCCCHEISSSTQFYELKFHTHLTSYRCCCCCFKDTWNGVSMGDTEGELVHAQTFLLFSIKFYIFSAAICIQISHGAEDGKGNRRKKIKTVNTWQSIKERRGTTVLRRAHASVLL